MIDVHSYLPVPYAVGGRTMAGLDCWGLVLRLRADLGLPKLAECSDAVRGNPMEMQRRFKEVSDGLEECGDIRPGVIAAVFKSRVIVHVALAIEIEGRTAFIETNPAGGVRWMWVDRFLKTYYKVKFYRDRDFPESA